MIFRVEVTTACLLALLIPVLGQAQTPGPFGLNMGMSKAAIETGSKLEAVEGQSNLYSTKIVPRPLDGVDFYTLLILPNAGLCQIRVAGRTINSSSHGVEIMARYRQLRDAIANTYGKYGESDFLRSGSIWDEPEDWMMALRRNERVLQAAYDAEEGSTMRNNVKQILLDAMAIDSSSGWILIQYKFENEEECQAEINQTTESIF